MRFFIFCLILVISNSRTPLFAQDFSLDQLRIITETDEPRVLLGQVYQSTIYLNQLIPENYNCKISVNGAQLSFVDQTATYTAVASTTGKKLYRVKVDLINTVDGSKTTLSKEYSYLVQNSSVSVVGDKMNVFFVGVDNPITVVTPDIALEDMEVSISNGELTKKSKNTYVVTCKKSGKSVVTVKDANTGKRYLFDFRVKRIPNPTVRFTRKQAKNSTLSVGELKEELARFSKQPALGAWLDNFDFYAICRVTSFTFIYYRNGKKRKEILNEGNRFQESITAIMNQARSGDSFIFTAVQGTCPGDEETRVLNSVVLRIK